MKTILAIILVGFSVTATAQQLQVSPQPTVKMPQQTTITQQQTQGTPKVTLIQKRPFRYAEFSVTLINKITEDNNRKWQARVSLEKPRQITDIKVTTIIGEYTHFSKSSAKRYAYKEFEKNIGWKLASIPTHFRLSALNHLGSQGWKIISVNTEKNYDPQYHESERTRYLLMKQD